MSLRVHCVPFAKNSAERPAVRVVPDVRKVTLDVDLIGASGNADDEVIRLESGTASQLNVRDGDS